MGLNCSDQHDASDETGRFGYCIQPDHAGVRLDHFLVGQLPSYTRSQITNAIKDGDVRVNGGKAKAGFKLKEGDEVSGNISEVIAADVVPQKVDFSILFEDEHLLVISKPPDLVVHPGSGNHDNTLVNGLVYHCLHIADVGDPVRPGIVHRLDKDTSGIMVIAKKNEVHRLLVEGFKDRRVKKTYHALVVGVIGEFEGRVCAPIGRHPVNRKKMSIREKTGKYAATQWHFEKCLDNRYSFVRINIETGRTHQIRVHMASIGHPVAGDALYGKAHPLFPRQMLHASKLSFNHPVSGRKMVVSAPLWPDIERIIQHLEDSGKEQ